MSDGPLEARAVGAPTILYRVTISTKGDLPSTLDPADADLRSAGNRFDVPGVGVFYCCTALEGCYRETLARLRVSPPMRELDEDNDNEFMRAGCVPASWRDARRIFRLAVPEGLRFLDVEHQETLTVLDGVAGIARAEPLDVAAIRGPDRLLTRAIASWAFTRLDESGEFRYAGIRYVSRLGQYECWAIFEGTPFFQAEPPREIALTDGVLQKVAREFGLTLH